MSLYGVQKKNNIPKCPIISFSFAIAISAPKKIFKIIFGMKKILKFYCQFMHKTNYFYRDESQKRFIQYILWWYKIRKSCSCLLVMDVFILIVLEIFQWIMKIIVLDYSYMYIMMCSSLKLYIAKICLWKSSSCYLIVKRDIRTDLTILL
jgi:hypothetical protein